MPKNRTPPITSIKTPRESTNDISHLAGLPLEVWSNIASYLGGTSSLPRVNSLFQRHFTSSPLQHNAITMLRNFFPEDYETRVTEINKMFTIEKREAEEKPAALLTLEQQQLGLMWQKMQKNDCQHLINNYAAIRKKALELPVDQHPSRLTFQERHYLNLSSKFSDHLFEIDKFFLTIKEGGSPPNLRLSEWAYLSRQRDKYNLSPLDWIKKLDHQYLLDNIYKRVCRIFLEVILSHADINTPMDEENNTFTHWVIICQQPVEDLIKRWKKAALTDILNKPNRESETALHFAACNRDLGWLKYLITNKEAHHLSLEVRDKEGNTPLLKAAAVGNLDAVKLLLDSGALFEAKNNRAQDLLYFLTYQLPMGHHKKNFLTALHIAAEHLPSLSSELLRVTNLNPQTKDRLTPLHYASSRGDLRLVKLLVERGDDPRLCDSRGWNCSHYAISAGSQAVLEFLKNVKGVDLQLINKTTNDLFNGLHIAAQYGKTKLFHYLQKVGLDIEAKDKFDSTPLHIAIQHHHINTTMKLLALDAKLDSSHLFLAARVGFLGLEKLLMELKKANVNLAKEEDSINLLTDNVGNTLLHAAIQMEKINSICTLLRLGARFDLNNAKGKTAADIANKSSDEIKSLFQLMRYHTKDSNRSRLFSTKIPTECKDAARALENVIIRGESPSTLEIHRKAGAFEKEPKLKKLYKLLQPLIISDVAVLTNKQVDLSNVASSSNSPNP